MLTPDQKDRHREVHAAIMRFGMAWRDDPEMLAVLPYVALWYSGARHWAWLWETFPAPLADRMWRAQCEALCIELGSN